MRRIGTTECDGAEWFPTESESFVQVFQSRREDFRLVALELPSGRATEIPIADDAARGSRSRRPHLAGWSVPPRRGSRSGVPGSCRSREVRLVGSQASALADPIGWTADGRQLFVQREGEVPERIQKLDLATGTVVPWKELTLEDLAGVVRIDPVRVAPDGRSWAYSYIRVLSNLYVVEGLR